MRLACSARTTVKDGLEAHENEDRFAFVQTGRVLRAAVADGATESAYSGPWAQALVEAWTDLADPWSTDTFLDAARGRWAESLPPRSSMSWFAEASVATGGHATGLFLEAVAARAAVYWRARAVGDTEMFALSGLTQLRMARAIPFRAHSAFSSTPSLASTTPGASVNWATYRGRVRRPFELWLATDALAEALLRCRGGAVMWARWRDAHSTPLGFDTLVAEWRAAGFLKNDDVTLLRIAGT